MTKTITGIVAWLKGWFFDKDEITSKEQALQSQINNKASQSDLNTTNSNINALESRVNNLEGIEFIKFVSTLPTASAETMNSLYLVPKSSGKTNDNYNIWVTAKNGSTYTWDKVDDFDLQTLNITWDSITNKPSTFAPSSHEHGNISNNGKLTVDANKVKKVVVTDNDDNISVISVNRLNCGSFTELQTLINNTSSGGTLILEKDYINTGSESHISISKPICIIGNGHVLDGNNVSKIFNMDNGANGSLIYDLNFINAFNKSDTLGGAVRAYSNNTFIKCRFMNNSLSTSLSVTAGGALYSENNVNIYQCEFNNNSAKNVGGAVRCSSNSNIKDSTFIKNSANQGGGIYYSGGTLNVYNCQFIESTIENVLNKSYTVDGVTNIELIPKSTDNSGAIRLYYGDES